MRIDLFLFSYALIELHFLMYLHTLIILNAAISALDTLLDVKMAVRGWRVVDCCPDIVLYEFVFNFKFDKLPGYSIFA